MGETSRSAAARAMFARVEAAARRLHGVARRTPLMHSRTVDETLGARVYFKCENLQNVGAFKFRGAYNAMSQLTPEQRAAGVLAVSSGNHAQAVARVGQMLGIRTTIVMPADAPATKLAATRGYGAEVVLYDPNETTRDAVAARLPIAATATMIPPFDHDDVIAGQGTAAMEVFDELDDVDRLLVPTGGGGLLAGTAVAAAFRSPACQVIGIEPETADDATRSFRSGTLHRIDNPQTIADGTRTPSLGDRNFELIRELVSDMQTVSEDDIVTAVHYLFERLKIVVEPSGALGFAALWSRRVEPGRCSVVLLSGGNIDAPTMQRILTAGVGPTNTLQ